MRFFRSTWLQKTLLLLLLVVVSAGPFGFIEQQQRGKDELVIHGEQLLAELSCCLQRSQIKYGFDVIQISVVPVFKQIISEEYIPGTSFDPLSIDILTQPSRGPPRLIAIL